jgi:hypothetical protein
MLQKLNPWTALVILGTIAGVVVLEVAKVPVPSYLVGILGTVVAGALGPVLGKGGES